ncbi:MAG TPA: hypothetical protein VHN80_31135, partial [Kineosporiaceae bacterium]|nr:hypothetical protein [Kineosporiaceae bacterium]
MPFLNIGVLRRRGGRRRVAAVTAAVVLATGGLVAVAATTARAAGNRLDLRVLVVDDGQSMTEALRQTMTVEGVPFTTVTLTDAGRPQLTADFLASGTEGKFQAVVLPNAAGTGVNGAALSAAELTALMAYETTFGVRQIDAYNYANSSLGLNAPVSPTGISGPMDGATATVTASGQAQGFGYLKGPIPFAPGSYGYIAIPLTATSTPPLAAGTSFTPLVTAPIPGSAAAGSLLGVFTTGGRSELVSTMNYNFGQQHFRMLAHGMISWMTQGVHLGYNRNSFTFHFDDAFAPDARWDSTNN